MRYQVPQFIEVEDKIFGPFTFKQFVYLAGGAGIGFVFYELLPLYIGIFFIVPVAALALALAFYKVNNQPFIKTLEYAFYYVVSTKLYLWKKEAPKEGGRTEPRAAPQALVVPAISQNKLKDLAWSLDVHEKIGSKGGNRDSLAL
ncbi:MAG: hypothetical protein UY94_C0007G0004 [Parcubacteria group bacterium GW2011_GWA2_56_21]|nr:MAG: hypothetical protein UY94_C0007G0004 [Parcubacteria group bacterium GW2011_GWA2_56_21]